MRGASSFGAVQQHQNVLLARRQIFKGQLEIDLVAVRGQMDQLDQILRRRARPQSAVVSSVNQSVITFAGSRS